MMRTTFGPQTQTVTDGNRKALNLVGSVPSETEEGTTCCVSSKESDTDSFIALPQVQMVSKTRGEGERHHNASHPVIDLTKQVKKRKKRKRLTVTQTGKSSSSSEETQSSIDRWSPTVSEEEVTHSRPRDSRCYFYVSLPSLQRAPADIIHLHRLLGYMMSTPNETDIPDPTPSHRSARVTARQEITKALSDFRWCINRYFDERQ